MDSPVPPTPETSESSPEGEGKAAALDAEWDETFAWSYGPRIWNIGCG